jgi:hypothetical protein
LCIQTRDANDFNLQGNLIDAGIFIRILSSEENGAELLSKAIKGGYVTGNQSEHRFFMLSGDEF